MSDRIRTFDVRMAEKERNLFADQPGMQPDIFAGRAFDLSFLQSDHVRQLYAFSSAGLFGRRTILQRKTSPALLCQAYDKKVQWTFFSQRVFDGHDQFLLQHRRSAGCGDVWNLSLFSTEKRAGRTGNPERIFAGWDPVFMPHFQRDPAKRDLAGPHGPGAGGKSRKQRECSKYGRKCEKPGRIVFAKGQCIGAVLQSLRDRTDVSGLFCGAVFCLLAEICGKSTGPGTAGGFAVPDLSVPVKRRLISAGKSDDPHAASVLLSFGLLPEKAGRTDLEPKNSTSLRAALFIDAGLYLPGRKK